MVKEKRWGPVEYRLVLLPGPYRGSPETHPDYIRVLTQIPGGGRRSSAAPQKMHYTLRLFRIEMRQ